MARPQSSVTGKELSGFFWVKVPQFLGCPSPKTRVPRPEQFVVSKGVEDDYEKTIEVG